GYLDRITATGDKAESTYSISRNDLAQLRDRMSGNAKPRIVGMDLGAKTWEIPDGKLNFGTKDGIPVKGVLGAGAVAEVELIADTAVLTRLSKMTAVMVNGKGYNRKGLEPGDVIKIGKSRFKYER
ncbi:MAG: FHA domain-containing protein, partial [Myxococcota bacterium]|nr:FHA domain-containing protein [Myxococcota bacterium]